MGAGAVILDDVGRVMLVNPTYKVGWEIPGGVVELNESPADVCRREVAEELGIAVEVGELMCVDYNRATTDYLESLVFLFRVPTLTSEQVDSIQLRAAEVSEYRFCTLDEARGLLPERVWRRVAAVLGTNSIAGCYLDDQRRIC